VLSVMRTMQSSSAEEEVKPGGPTYQFQRAASEPTDSLLHGTGFPGARTGMIRSAFRPSDDATRMPFLVPANAMAVVELRAIARVLNETSRFGAHGGGRKGSSSSSSSSNHDNHNNAYSARALALASDALALAKEVDAALQTHAVVTHPTTGKTQLAYEVDGFGNMLFMDDANVPSLLSLPYLGYFRSNNDPLYQSTRASVWSGDTNPYFFSGSAGEGIGGPHVGLNMIWPMSIIMRALTSDDATEVQGCVDTLLATTGGTGLMHESFEKDGAGSYTRPWFAWANSLFGELIVRTARDMPEALGLPRTSKKKTKKGAWRAVVQ
jgi:meiotically up-regulated gene 157 (Mug157) protein